MKPIIIWNIEIPLGGMYAELLKHYKEPKGIRCKKCDALLSEQLQPITVEWDDGSDVIGDFVGGAGATAVLRTTIADELLKHFHGFEKGAIEFFDHPNLYPPKRITKKTARRVWLPYTGPELCTMVVTREVELHAKSTVVIEEECSACGARQYEEFVGVEEWSGRTHKPRISGKGLFVERRELHGCDFFKPRFCTAPLKLDHQKPFLRA